MFSDRLGHARVSTPMHYARADLDLDVDEGHMLVTATVHDSQQLEWWLRGFGRAVEVNKPANLLQCFLQGCLREQEL
jgi:predicted DNA-binding transcriptional regulator YafY